MIPRQENPGASVNLGHKMAALSSTSNRIWCSNGRNFKNFGMGERVNDVLNFAKKNMFSSFSKGVVWSLPIFLRAFSTPITSFERIKF